MTLWPHCRTPIMAASHHPSCEPYHSGLIAGIESRGERTLQPVADQVRDVGHDTAPALALYRALRHMTLFGEDAERWEWLWGALSPDLPPDRYVAVTSIDEGIDEIALVWPPFHDPHPMRLVVSAETAGSLARGTLWRSASRIAHWTDAFDPDNVSAGRIGIELTALAVTVDHYVEEAARQSF